MHVSCPFCGHLCDGMVKLSFCINCFAEFWPQEAKPWRFTFTDQPTGKLSWSKAICRAGGFSFGNTSEVTKEASFTRAERKQ